MKRKYLFNFKNEPTCPECGSTNVNLLNAKSESIKNGKGFIERDQMVCEECGHAYSLVYKAKLVEYKPNDEMDEYSGDMIERKKERVR